MTEVRHIYCLNDLLAVLHKDLDGNLPSRFSCRPLYAYDAGKNTVLGRFKGDIGLPGLTDFTSALNELLVDRVEKVILDFRHVALTRTAVGALMAFAASVYGTNRRLYLYQCSQQVRDMLADLGIADFFSFIETEDAFIAKLTV